MEIFELKRQVVHLVVGIAIVSLFAAGFFNPINFSLILIIGFLLALISRKIKIPLISYFLNSFERENVFPAKGLLLMGVGSLLAVLLFETKIALASIMILALGDSVSCIVGTYWGKYTLTHSDKHIEGMLAGIIAATIGASYFVSPLFGFIAAFVVLFAELYDFKINDNIYIPIIAGMVIYLLQTF